MLQNVKAMMGVSVLLALSACASRPQEKNVASTVKPSFQVISANSPSTDLRTEADYLFISADVLSREGKSEEAIPLFEKVAKLDPAVPVYLRLSAEYLKVNKINEAIMSAEKAVQKDSKDINARFSLAELYAIENDNEKAISQYQVLLSLQPENTDALIGIASLYTQQKNISKAQHYYNLVLKNPSYESAYLIHYYLGVTYAEQEKSAYDILAVKAFSKSLSLKPAFEDAVLASAKVYLKQKDTAAALKGVLAFQAQHGFHQKSADFIAQTYIDTGALDKAQDQLRFIADNSDNSFNPNFKIALLLIKSQRHQAALEQLNGILLKFPESDAARYYLAAVQEEVGDLESSVRNYMLVPATSEYSNEAVTHAAYLLKTSGNIKQALALTGKALKGKANAQVYLMHASLLQQSSDYVAEVSSLAQGIEKHPADVELRFQYAVGLDRLGKADAVVKQMKKVLEMNADHVQALSYLAYTMAEKNHDLSEAEKLARHASSLAPDDGYVLDTLGWVLYKQKRFSEAVTVLEKAVKYQPSAAIIAEHLAMAHTSQTQKNKEIYKNAASFSTNEARSTAQTEMAD